MYIHWNILNNTLVNIASTQTLVFSVRQGSRVLGSFNLIKNVTDRLGQGGYHFAR